MSINPGLDSLEFKGTYYTSWYSEADRSRGQTQKSYLDKLHKVGCFDSLDSFSDHWKTMMMNYFPIASGMLTFREAIKPVWEEDANRKGGKFAFACTQGYEDAIQKFLKIVTAMITGGLEPSNNVSIKNDSICGVIISMRLWGGTITVWNNDGDEEKVEDIQEKLYKIVGRSERILYQKHSKSIAENRKHIFCKRSPVTKNVSRNDKKRSNRDKRKDTQKSQERKHYDDTDEKKVVKEARSGKDESGSEEEERNGVTEKKQDVVVLEVVDIGRKEEICIKQEDIVNSAAVVVNKEETGSEREMVVENCNIVNSLTHIEDIVDLHKKDDDSGGEWSSDETEVYGETNSLRKVNECGTHSNTRTRLLLILFLCIIFGICFI